MTPTSIVRNMLSESTEYETDRISYLGTNLGKARAKVAELDRLTRRGNALALEIGTALSRGDGYAIRLCEDLLENERDQRIAAKELEMFVRLHSASRDHDPTDRFCTGEPR